jgi:hypothetical protein
MLWPSYPDRSTNKHTVLWSSAVRSGPPCVLTEFNHNCFSRILFGCAYLDTISSLVESDCTSGESGMLYQMSVQVASVCMTIKVYCKTLLIGPIKRYARVSIQSTIHPMLTRRRRARKTYRTHGPCWMAPEKSSFFKKRRVSTPFASEKACASVDDHQYGSCKRQAAQRFCQVDIRNPGVLMFNKIDSRIENVPF